MKNIKPLSAQSTLQKGKEVLHKDSSPDAKPLFAVSGSVVQKVLKKGRRLVNVDSKPAKYVNIQGKSIPFFWAETSPGSWNLVSLYSFMKPKKEKEKVDEAKQ